MRLFIAIGFSELKDYLVSLQSKIDKSLVKLNEVDTFHLTLKFLGEVDKPELVQDKLKGIKFEPFSLTIDKIGVFPSENYVKVIWVGVKPHSEVNELQRKIEDVLSEYNFKKDFDFHPHITLARVKFVSDKEKVSKNLKEIKVEPKTIEVKDFRLVKSTLMRAGPVYEDVEVFKAR